VGQPRAAGHHLSRPGVHFPPVRRTEIGIDRRPVQRMGKAQLQRRSTFGQQSGGDSRVHLVLRIEQSGHRHDHGAR